MNRYDVLFWVTMATLAFAAFAIDRAVSLYG